MVDTISIFVLDIYTEAKIQSVCLDLNTEYVINNARCDLCEDEFGVGQCGESAAVLGMSWVYLG